MADLSLSDAVAGAATSFLDARERYPTAFKLRHTALFGERVLIETTRPKVETVRAYHEFGAIPLASIDSSVLATGSRSKPT